MTDSESPLADVAAEAYIYLYPLVTMELTRRQATNIEAGKMPGRGPMNQFNHIRAFPDADFKMVVRANFDTLYSSAWIDLTTGPVVISAADTRGRYYMLPMLDMWTDVIASPGKRTSGTGEGHWALTPPGWSGRLPDGVEQIAATTPHLWIIGRTQTNGTADYGAVATVQDGYSIRLLSEWGKEAAPVTALVDPSIDMTTPPLDLVNAMSGPEYFALGAELMKVHAPHASDWSQVRRMRSIGLIPGESFVGATLEKEAADAVAAAPQAGRGSLATLLPTMAAMANGWQMNTNSIGVYGNFYGKRAIASMVGLGANPPEDAVYPLLLVDAQGDKPDGSRNYVLHFEREDLPPANAFWSVTMYDEHGFQAANELDRYAIGDRDPLCYNDDGSLDLFLQHANPGPQREANWLPAPRGPLGITMRLYAPRSTVLDGAWAPPALVRAH